MRIAIVGAGIAGLTLASLLKQRGITPTIIEKAHALSDVGYMLGLFPIGSCVLHGLNCFDEYLSISQPVDTYTAHTHSAPIKAFSLKAITQDYGPYQNITRAELISLLYQTCKDLPIRFNTEVTHLEQNADGVTVCFNNGESERFDCLVGADGIHSSIRQLVFSQSEYRYHKTGWGAWVWWCDASVIPASEMHEFWGVGAFCGLYPVKGKIGVVAGIDADSEAAALSKHQSRKALILERFAELVKYQPKIFESLPDDSQQLFFWSLSDQRCQSWHRGRVVLVGDAAAAFLPTAGVGASMALGSAAALHDELMRTDAQWVHNAFALYEKRRKQKVEAAQQDSRNLAKMMFVSNRLGAGCRNVFTKWMSTESLIKSIVKGFDQPL